MSLFFLNRLMLEIKKKFNFEFQSQLKTTCHRDRVRLLAHPLCGIAIWWVVFCDVCGSESCGLVAHSCGRAPSHWGAWISVFPSLQIYRRKRKPAVDRICVGIPPGEVNALCLCCVLSLLIQTVSTKSNNSCLWLYNMAFKGFFICVCEK